MDQKSFNFDRTVRLLLTISVIIALFVITRRLSGVLLPFVVAWFIAYMLNPIVNFFQTKVRLKNRVLSVIVTLIVVLGIIVGLGMLLSMPIKHQVARMGVIVNTYMNGMDAKTIIPDEWQQMLRELLNQINVREMVTSIDWSSIANKGTSLFGSILGTSISVLEGLLVVFIVILYLVFILLDFDSLSEGFINIIPCKYRHFVSNIMSDLSVGMSKYFRGQAIIAMSVGALFALGFSIMGLPMGIVVGLFIGLLNMIPYMQTLGIPICMILGLMQSAETGTNYLIILLEIAAVFCIVQAIQDFLLTPKIMGDTLGMKPAVMLLALSIWGSLLGVAGMIIALPLTTVLISTYKHYVLEQENVESEQIQVQESPVKQESSTTE